MSISFWPPRILRRLAWLASAILLPVAASAQGAPARAKAPLPFQTVERLSAYDMIDRMGTNIHIAYQIGRNNPHDLPNRNAQKELISALRYLGIHHVRNQGLDDDPNASAGTPYPNVPTDFENLLILRKAIPRLKLNYLIDADGPPRWREGSRKDPVVNLKKLARLGVLASIEAPNEPNNQTTFSPKNEKYPQNLAAYNRIWKDWGEALQQLRKEDPAFAGIPLLPPSIAAHGPNGPDGVEAHHAETALTDYRSLYDLMNIHVYSAFSGISLGDPMGPIENGMPPNYGSYQLSIPNWGRYAMPGRRTIITESGANTRKGLPAGQYAIPETIQALVIVNNYFWAVYYGAERLYQYQIVDDSTDLTDVNAERWGMYRGDWSPKPAADLVHRFTKVLADDQPSDPARIPAFTVTGKKAETWGATMALSKSDGSYVIAANNTLRWWDPATGRDILPRAEKWRITLPEAAVYTITDVKSGEQIGPMTGAEIDIGVRGYPVLVHIRPKRPPP